MAISSQPSRVKAGDVVRLKSGGPRMTAERVDHRVELPYAHCIWIDARSAARTMFVKLDALELASGDDDQPDSS